MYQASEYFCRTHCQQGQVRQVIIAGKDAIQYLCALKGNQATERLHQQRLDLKGCPSHPHEQITPVSGQHKWVWKIAVSGCVKRNIQPSRIINLSDCRAACKNEMSSIRDAELQEYGEKKITLNRRLHNRDLFQRLNLIRDGLVSFSVALIICHTTS